MFPRKVNDILTITLHTDVILNEEDIGNYEYIPILLHFKDKSTTSVIFEKKSIDWLRNKLPWWYHRLTYYHPISEQGNDSIW